MKKILFLLVAILMSFSAFSQDTLKVMSYNIRNGNGMDKVRSYERIADVILKQAPDVVAVQEVDSMTKRSLQTYVLGEVAKYTRMYDFYGPAIDYSGGKYGIGILSKKKPLRIEKFAMPGREEKRALLLAEFEDYIFCCTHLSLREEDRMSSLRIIKDIARKQQKPFIVAGDMNAEPESDFVKEMKEDFIILLQCRKTAEVSISEETLLERDPAGRALDLEDRFKGQIYGRGTEKEAYIEKQVSAFQPCPDRPGPYGSRTVLCNGRFFS